MTFHVPDDILTRHRFTPAAFALEVACRLFDAEVLSIQEARRLAGLERSAFEAELLARGIAVHRPTPEDLSHDLSTLEGLRAGSRAVPPSQGGA